MARWKYALAVASASMAGVALLGVLGEVLAPKPRWEPRPYDLPPLTDAAPEIEPAAGQEPTDEYEVRREEVTVEVEGDELAASVFSPDAAGRYPAVAFVHGAGVGNGSSHFDLAERFARAGIVAVAYDKRDDYSYFWNRDFDQLAEDATAVVRMMRQRPDVDPDRAGLWGLSEGGRVVPLAASRSDDVGFVVTVGGAVSGPLRNTAWSVYEGLAAEGAPAGARSLAVHVLGGGYLFTLHLDPPSGVWSEVQQPALVIYGNNDYLVPPAESSRIIVDGLQEGRNSGYAVRFFGDADHGLRQDGGLAPGYVRTMTDWISGLPGSAEASAAVAGPLPVQRYASTVVPRAPWYGGVHALAVTVVLTVVGAVVIPVAARRRLRASAGAGWHPNDRAARWSTRSAVVAFGALWGYIAVLIGLGYTRNGAAAVYQVGWGLVRATALAAVILAAVLALRAFAGGGRLDRAQWLVLGGRLGVVVLLLLNLAYWGVFAPRW
ncbi:alpha/beta hydrolase family protein [Phytoactinopolyspora endophytica]|uniref:alpha/beta hydrolase family protein n=1 Tax=Phytoactinopolyspora endophytica TaxID=1642495 RepID=UPI00101C1EC0|nr:prolyl oligopeptidase family serine peptidase [Phytoactinopolyspora endophytica]